MKENRYSFDTTNAPDFFALLGHFRGKSLRSPYRSTVPLLSLVEHSQPQWNSLLDSLGVPPDATIHFEYRVASPKPGGNPSQTDALLLSDSKVWAIEAKWTEPRYETVAKRISEPEADGADSRVTVSGWLSHLQPFASRPIRLDDFSDVIYQIFHRAASACAVAVERGLQPELVYLHFHPSSDKRSATTADYVNDLAHLHEVLGNPTQLKFVVIEVPLHPTPSFEVIKDLDKHSSDTAEKVSAALCKDPLFTFGTPTITRIHE